MSLKTVFSLEKVVSRNEDLDFDIATQILNLSYYSPRSIDLASSLSDRLIVKCLNSVSKTLRSARNGGLQAVSEIVQVNPVNTLSAILSIAEDNLARVCIEDYVGLIEGLTEQRFNPVSFKNQTILAAYLGQLADKDIAKRLAKCLIASADDSGDEHGAHGVCQQVLRATQFGAMVAPDALGERAAFIRPMAMASVRRRDIISLASTIIADCLSGQERLLCVEYETWLLRTRNEHGLFGTWTSIDPQHVKALLATTLQAYRAIECLAADSRGIVPGIAARAQAQTGEATEAAKVDELDIEAASAKCVFYCQWLESHIDRFVIADQMQDYAEIVNRIKPSVELALTLYLIKESPNANTELKKWAKKLATQLFESISWSGLIEFFRMNPSASLGLLIFPLTAKAAEREIPFAETINEILCAPYSFAQERSPMRKMDFCFLARLMGADDQRFHDVEDQLSHTLLGSRAHPLWYSIDGLYDATHAIFYATDFGMRNTAFNKALSQWIGAHLPDLTLESLVRGDLDLAGEFVLCSYYLGYSQLEKHRMATARYVRSLPEDKPVPGPGMDLRDGLDEFDTCYHTTLVAALALTEILGSSFRGQFGLETKAKQGSPQVSDETSFAPKPSVFGSAEIAAKLLSIDVAKIEPIGASDKNTKYLIHSRENNAYMLARYADPSVWPTIKGSIDLALRATELGLAAVSVVKAEISDGCLFVVRDFASGIPLAESNQYSIPAITGAFAAKFHAKLASHRGQLLHNYVLSWANALNSGMTEILPSNLVDCFLGKLASPYFVIHGDLNNTNLLICERSEEIFAIDFDSAGIGLPEQELALVLASQYSAPGQLQYAKQSLVDSYVSHGGKIDEDLLNACIVTAPIFIFYMSYTQSQWDTNTSSMFRKTCLLRVRNLLEAIG